MSFDVGWKCYPASLKAFESKQMPSFLKIFRDLALVAVALAGAGAALAAPYPGEAQMRAAIAEAADVLRAEGLQVEALDAIREGVRQPLMAAGIHLASGTCRIYFNTRPEDGLTQFFAGLDERDMPVWLAAIAVHEAAHCIEQREAYVRLRFEKVLPTHIMRGDMTVQGYSSVVKSGAVETWGEALADIASVLYLKKIVPQRWTHFAAGIATMREDLARKWPQHDTSAWLRNLIAANPDIAGESVFEAAFDLRRRLRPH